MVEKADGAEVVDVLKSFLVSLLAWTLVPVSLARSDWVADATVPFVHALNW